MENFLQVVDQLHSDSVAKNHPSSWIAPPSPLSGLETSVETTERFPRDLSVVPTRKLRALCDQKYEQLDGDYPPGQAREQYGALVEEIERREATAENPETVARPRAAPGGPREAFRDNPLLSRFELFHEGILAGYVKYEMRGGDVLLLQTVTDPQFSKMKVEPVLIQHILLNAHRRRLAVTPFCPKARGFLTDNPQYLTLLPRRQRRRFQLLQAADRYENSGG